MEIEELEKKRKELKSKLFLCIIICFIILVLITAIMIYVNYLLFKFGEMEYKVTLNKKILYIVFDTIFAIVIGICAYVIIYRKKNKEYIILHQQYFVLTTLKRKFTNLKYDYDKGIEKQIIIDTELVEDANIYSSNNYFEGYYDKNKFIQANVNIQRSTSDNFYTLFQGRFVIIEFTKNINNSFKLYQYKNIKDYLINELFSKGYKKVELLSEEFNNMFSLYSKDELKIKQLFKDNLINKIIELAQKNNGKLLISLENNKLFFGLDSFKNNFDANILKKLDKERILSDIEENINLLISIVEQIQLNQEYIKDDD